MSPFKFLQLIALVFLAGCVTVPQEPQLVIKEVKVPVIERCTVEFPPEPEDHVLSATELDFFTMGSVILKDLEAYRHYSRALRAILIECADPK